MENLVNNPWAKIDEKADLEIPLGTMEIYQHVNDTLNKKEKDTNVLRASEATNCVKRRWYKAQGKDGQPLAPRKLVNFLAGDITEIVVKHFIAEGCVGIGKLYQRVEFGSVSGSIDLNGKRINLYDQPTLSFNLPSGKEITAHPDGFAQRHDGSWELIEIKSAANWGFNDFKNQEPDYVRQAHAVMLTDQATKMNCRSVRFFYMRKETGHIWDRSFAFQDEIAAQVILEFEASVKQEMPVAPYRPEPLMKTVQRNKEKVKIATGKETVKFPCTYCPYVFDCHGSFDIEWERGQYGVMSPVYVRDIKS